MTFEIKKICCIGAGYVGGPTMAVIADKCPHIKVEVVDINKKRIDSWNDPDTSKIPIYEPGLALIVKRCRGHNLFFSCEVKKNISEADMIFISVNTPTKTKGIGAGKASDLKYVEASAREVARYATKHTIVVEKSTLPVRTAEVIKTILEEAQSDKSDQKEKPTFDVLSNPEFLSEGSAIQDLNMPDRVLIGGENEDAIKALSEIYRNWVSDDKILHTNIWSSELAKLTANAFLAQRISSINSISAICEATGADVREVSRAIGTDNRIGPKFLDSGPGFGGSCFKKDILNLVYLSQYFGLPEVAQFWEGVVHLNKWHQHRISTLVVQKLFGSLSGKKLVILGFAFKANTNDTRESAAIQICKDLLDEGGKLTIHDPIVQSIQIENDLGKSTNNINEGEWISTNNLSSIFKDAHAIIILTEWEIYSKLDWTNIAKDMKQPGWVFDSRSVVNKQQVIDSGLNLWLIGNGK